MDFWKTILGRARQKLAIVSVFVLALGAGLAGYFLTPLHYVSSATMVLSTPARGGTVSQDPTRPTGLTNPMVSFSNDLKTASAILIYAMNTPIVAAELGVVERGPTKLTIDDGRTDPNMLYGNGPFVYVVGESRSKTEAQDVVIRAQARMRQELVDRQKALDAPPETYLTMVDVVAPTIPKLVRADRFKAGGIALVLTFVVGLGIAYTWQSVRASRHRVAEGKLSPTPGYVELDSRNQDRQELLSRAVDDRSASVVVVTADKDSTTAEDAVDQGERDLAYEFIAEEQPAAGEQPAAEELEVAGEQPAAEELEVAGEQPAAEELEVAGEQPAAEELEVAGEQPAAEELEVAGEQPAAEELEVAGEQPAAEELEVAGEQPAAEELEVAGEQPAAEELEVAGEQPAAEELEVAGEQPAAEELEVAGEQPAAEELEVAGEQPAAEELEVAGEQPAAEELEVAGEQPAAEELEVAGEQPAAEELEVAGEQPAAEELEVAGEQPAAEELEVAGEQPAAEEQPGADAEHSTEPEHFVDVSEKEHVENVWNLYIAEYPPPKAMTADDSEDDILDWTLDWSVDRLQSEQRSAVVGRRQGG